jgi:hypothetical protein
MSNIDRVETTEFQQVQGIISLHRSHALQTVNNENLLAAWEVGAFVSDRLKKSVWGSKTVKQLSEYMRAQDPTLRGYSSRNIYNMVAFYDTYSSFQFVEFQKKLKLNEFVQPLAAQIESAKIIQPAAELIVQALPAQFPTFLELTTLTNHFEILNACKTYKFKPEYMGQLEFYLEALDRDVRRSNENPSIGILLCQEADRSVVEYAMSRSLSPTMIAEYERQLIPKEILQRSLEEFTHFLNPKSKK